MSKRVITLGTWNGNPIEWIVLKEDDFSALVVSKNVLFTKRFDSGRSNSGNKWDTCEIRRYLNDSFYNDVFSKEEQKRIINCKILGEGFKDTKNNIFLLSANEASDFMTKDERKTNNIWSLRTIHYDGLQYTSHVNADGVVKDRSSECTYTDNSYWIRPAMYVKE